MKKLGLFTLAIVIVLVSCKTTQLIDFNNISSIERIPLGTTTPIPVVLGDHLNIGDVLIEKKTGTTIDILSYKWPDGNYADGTGFVRIIKSQKAGGTGNEVHFNNATLWVRAKANFDIKEFEFKYVDMGGNINLVEKHMWYFDDNFQMIPSPTPNGMIILVTPPNANKGTIHVSGTLDKFKYYGPIPPNNDEPIIDTIYYIGAAGGGQELWIDDLKLIGK